MTAPTDLSNLERELAQLKEQMPAHSIPPSLLERIDALEQAIDALKNLALPTQSENQPGLPHN